MPWDPNTEEHMERVLLAVKAYWKKNPHLRLGQLISGVAAYDPEWKGGCDPFYVTDEILERNIIKRL
jgi:uncharacterized protein YihD (DUF1040 family)